MRTFKQFIAEEEKAEPLADLLERRCRSFLNRSGQNGLLYRGVNSFGNAEKLVVEQEPGQNRWAYIMSVRKNRRPMTMDPKLSKVIDHWFEDRFGIRARSQALFCYGEGGAAAAEAYGHHKCVVFPIGSFTYVWSPGVDDLYYEVQADLKGVVDPTEIDRYLSQLGYTINDLDKAVMSDSEIMVDCDQFIAVPYHSLADLRALKKFILNL